jgi:hypothetical protein
MRANSNATIKWWSRILIESLACPGTRVSRRSIIGQGSAGSMRARRLYYLRTAHSSRFHRRRPCYDLAKQATQLPLAADLTLPSARSFPVRIHGCLIMRFPQSRPWPRRWPRVANQSVSTLHCTRPYICLLDRPGTCLCLITQSPDAPSTLTPTTRAA